MPIRMFVALSLVFSLAWGQAAAPVTQTVLSDATPVKLRLARNLSSNTEDTGSTVDFEVLEEVLLNGTVVIAKGAVAIGTITDSQKARRMGRAGKLNVTIDHARTVTNDKIALRAVRESEGGSNAGKMTGAIVATSIVFFPAAPLFLMMKGKEYKIPKGTEITAYVNGDTRLDLAKYSGAQAQAASNAGGASQTTIAPTAPTGKVLANEDIISLKEIGVGDDVITAKIASSTCAFKLDVEDLAKLKKSGISDAVIKAMLERTGK